MCVPIAPARAFQDIVECRGGGTRQRRKGLEQLRLLILPAARADPEVALLTQNRRLAAPGTLTESGASGLRWPPFVSSPPQFLQAATACGSGYRRRCRQTAELGAMAAQDRRDRMTRADRARTACRSHRPRSRSRSPSASAPHAHRAQRAEDEGGAAVSWPPRRR